MAAKFFTGLPLDGPDPECVLGHGETRWPPADRRPPPRPSPDHSRWYAAGAPVGPPAPPARPGLRREPAGRLRARPQPPLSRCPAWSNRWRWPADGALAGGVRPARDQPRARIAPSATATWPTTGPGRRGVPAWWSPRRPRSTRRTGPTSGPRWPSRAGPGWAAVAGACRPPRHPGAGRAGSLRRPGIERPLAVGAVGARRRVADVVSREMPMEMEPSDIDAAGRPGSPPPPGWPSAPGSTGWRSTPGPISLLRQFHSGLTNLRSDALRIRPPAPDRRGARRRRGPPSAPTACCRSGCPATSWPPGPGSPPNTPADQVAALADLVDLIVVVRGGPFSTSAYRPDAHTPAGFNLELCRGHARGGGRPGRRSCCRAAWSTRRWPSGALDDGIADLVEMTRAQIADPRLVDPGARRAGRTGSGPASCATRPATSGTTAIPS